MMESTGFDLDELAQTSEREQELVDNLLAFARANDLNAMDAAGILLELTTLISSRPNAAFSEFPVYFRELESDTAIRLTENPLVSSHRFFDVVRARGSRRDFGQTALDHERLMAILQWTFGIRGEMMAYDFRGTPLRFVASAGGLASCDAYVIVNRVSGLEMGSYYFDPKSGLRSIVAGTMIPSLAYAQPELAWIEEAAVIVVLVMHVDRLSHKYGAMTAKLGLLDAGVALGHLELVAAALELRSTIVGSLPTDRLRGILDLSDERYVPMASIAIGTRG